MNDTFGLILAGGQGRRMGGADKALLQLAGLPLAAHAAARLGPQCGALALNANGSAERLSALGLPVVADEIADAGPLAGVLAGLRFARESGYAFLCTLSVDAPFAPLDLVVEHPLAEPRGDEVAGDGCRHDHACPEQAEPASSHPNSPTLPAGPRSGSGGQASKGPPPRSSAPAPALRSVAGSRTLICPQ